MGKSPIAAEIRLFHYQQCREWFHIYSETVCVQDSNKKKYILHKFTGLSLRTEAHQVVDTDDPPRVSVSAVRT